VHDGYTPFAHTRVPRSRIAIESKFMREIDGISSALAEKDGMISSLSEKAIASIDRVFEMAMVRLAC
jgi:hypothetical protein